MNDLISRDVLLKHSRRVVEFDEGGFSIEYNAIPTEEIKKAHAVDAKPVVHGEWIHDINNLYKCSVCMSRETMSPKKKKNFCPECGARMDGE